MNSQQVAKRLGQRSVALSVGSTKEEHVERRRALHLVDIENLLGDPQCMSSATIAEVCQAYLRLSLHSPGDEVLVASNPRLARSVAFELNVPSRLYPVRGPDAADRQLIAAADLEKRAGRIDTLVIGSGDHIFARQAWIGRRAGLRVRAVSRRDAMAGLLTSVAHDVVFFPSLSDCAAALAQPRPERPNQRDRSIRAHSSALTYGALVA